MGRMQAMTNLVEVSGELEMIRRGPQNKDQFAATLRKYERVLEEYIAAHSGDNINQRDAVGGPLLGADDGCDPFRDKLAEVREILSRL
jgi:hypothetical protein